MLETEKAYVAGVIDGEVSIMLTRFHKNEYHSPFVSIASTDLELLEWAKLTIESGKITSKKNYNEERHKDSYTYTITYDDAIKLLQELEPYLVIYKKKARAQHIISKYKKVTLRNGRYSETQKLLKEQFYTNFIAL